ncbi:Saposin-like protein [Dioscorea alata]|uniref:Saposin-like protein n=1 Tax=Dioscorea alata TaxID=55571 RepID=A0ACB7W2I6_DIOAL|nr:Saposin-like protein [Dioscorea alata]
MTQGVKEKQPRKERASSRDVVADMNTRLSKMELVVAEGQERGDDVEHHVVGLEHRVEGIEHVGDEFREEMQGALNITASKCLDHVKSLEDSLQPRVVHTEGEIARVYTELCARLKQVEEELAICKRMIAQGASVAIPATTSSSSKIDVPRPKPYNGSRNAKEIDNYFWGLEQYFKAHGLEEAKKVDSAALYLTDAAMIWWRRRYGDIEKGTLTINTFDDFKMELKKQFYPENAENEARAKLRGLSCKNSIQEYVKEFSEVLFEITDYPNKEALFVFMDGLQHWARLEIQRSGAQDLATAITIAESLIEFKKPEKTKSFKDKGFKGKNGGKSKKENFSKFSKPKEGRNTPESKEHPPLKCYFCDGPHFTRNCPNKSKISALVEEKENAQEEKKMGSLRILDAIKAKVEAKARKRGVCL